MSEPGPPRSFVPAPTGVEGRASEMGNAIAMVIKTFQNTQPYEHQVNDALVKSYLAHVEFAVRHGLIEEAQLHQVETLMPVLQRVRALVERTGDPELGIVGMFDRTSCHFQLVEYTETEPGLRRFPCAFARVHAAGSRIGQFSFSLEQFHELWCRPVWEGYARELGIALDISGCNGGMVCVQLAKKTAESMETVEAATV